MTKVNESLRKIGKPTKREPLWEGPESDGPQGGITQSLLAKFLVCRERFRVAVVEGLKVRDTFRPQIEYGNMWHVCEESHAGNRKDWMPKLSDYCKNLCKKYPLEQDQISHWFNLCKTFFPLYVDHWNQHPDVKNRTPLLQEETFKIPYKLPSGRTVYLRGKWDSVDLVNRGKESAIYIQENKTKSTIDRVKLSRFLRFDLQLMFYIVALINYRGEDGFPNIGPIRGVRYNLIRRPAHKSVESALEKYNNDVKAGRHEEWFCRFIVEVSKKDIENFQHKCLWPTLEMLCDWWEHMTSTSSSKSPFDCRAGDRDYMTHFQMPYGIYNPLTEGGICDVDGYLEDGSEVGLKRSETLFPELQ